MCEKIYPEEIQKQKKKKIQKYIPNKPPQAGKD